MNVQLRELTTVSSHSFVSPASYWMPDLINGSAWLEHAPFGFWIVEALRPRMIVELGVHGGFSYSVFCQAVQRLHLPRAALRSTPGAAMSTRAITATTSMMRSARTIAATIRSRA